MERNKFFNLPFDNKSLIEELRFEALKKQTIEKIRELESLQLKTNKEAFVNKPQDHLMGAISNFDFLMNSISSLTSFFNNKGGNYSFELATSGNQTRMTYFGGHTLRLDYDLWSQSGPGNDGKEGSNWYWGGTFVSKNEDIYSGEQLRNLWQKGKNFKKAVDRFGSLSRRDLAEGVLRAVSLAKPQK
jgi:hypothetical protein